MKQVMQQLGTGKTTVTDVPCPAVEPGHLLIASRLSLVSVGTERMLVEFGRAGLLEKARLQPEKVSMILDKVRTDGLMPTLETVRSKLDESVPMGYCNLGTVAAIGAGVTGFAVGDRVASNGRHAEIVSVPVNLCAKVPATVADEAAVFTVIGAIGLQGIRLAQPTLGECVVVTGLGLLGLITVQLLRANGCRVLGIDMDPGRLELARRFGAETVDLGAGTDPVAVAAGFSRSRGVDAVIVTAATRSSEPMHQAAQMCRKRGRIVLVGVAGLELSRADFYGKELTFQVSCSYGPGRYDQNYELRGNDYPVGYVRWTEQRNFEAALDMLDAGRVAVAELISHRFKIDDAAKAYEVVAGTTPSLGIVIEYAGSAEHSGDPRSNRVIELGSTLASRSAPSSRAPRVSVIGAGNYARAMLLPAFRAAGVGFQCIAGSTGLGSVTLGRKFDFRQVTTDYARLISDPGADAIVIATRHESHARYVVAALEAGKHVFVEKPLCISTAELAAVAHAARAHPHATLMVGFNRRFAPHVQRIEQLLRAVPAVKAFLMTVNAGRLAADHWTQDPGIGGGRLVGECCHFIDLLRHLAGAAVESVDVCRMADVTPDSAAIVMRFANGSIGTIHYLANGSRSFPKERLEIFASGAVLQLDNFRRLRGFGWPGFTSMSLWRQDKGQRACVAAFVDSVQRGASTPIPLAQLLEVAEVSIKVQALAS